MVEAVLFDCFNTLVTDAKGVYFAEKRQRAYLLLKKSRQNLSYEYFKDCWLQTFDAMTSVAKETLREFAMETFVAEVQKKLGTSVDNDLLSKVYIEDWLLGVHAKPGVGALLKRLHETIQIAVVSNTHTHGLVEAALAKGNVDRSSIDCIVTSIENGYRKPHPAMLQKALKALHVEPGKAVMIGDSLEDDLGAAQQAGVPCIIINDKITNDYVDTEEVKFVPNILDIEGLCKYHS